MIIRFNTNECFFINLKKKNNDTICAANLYYRNMQIICWNLESMEPYCLWMKVLTVMQWR